MRRMWLCGLTTTFIAFTSRIFLNGKPNLLSSVTASHWTIIPSSASDQVALTLHEIADIELIWTDSGSGANRDFSLYKDVEPAGYYLLGHIGIPSHTKPSFSTLAKAIKDDVFRASIGYLQRWNDAG